MKKLAIVLILPLAIMLNACTSRIGANEYSTGSTGEVNRVMKGRILSVRAVNIESDSPMGGIVGAGAGGVAGSMLGGNDATSILGAIGGAAIGGIVGDAAGGAMSSQGGYEYVVELDSGSIITVTQGNDVLMNPGERCLVLYGNQARVIPYSGVQ